MTLRLLLALCLPLTLIGCAITDPVRKAEASLADAYAAGDIAKAASSYAQDALVRPDYQPAFCGSDMASYLETVGERRTITTFDSTVTEIFDLGEDSLVFGRFDVAGTTSSGEQFSEAGRFARLWTRPQDGSMPARIIWPG